MSNHLVEDFKDRVPTEVLSNGAVRWEQFDSNGNSLGYVYLKRADEPIEVGNVWNKLIYDGIKSEFGDVLYTAEKATQAEAEEGVDDTKYMTPLKVKNAVKERVVHHEIFTTKSYLDINLEDYLTSGANKIEVVLNAIIRNGYVSLNGTGIKLCNFETSGDTSVQVTPYGYSGLISSIGVVLSIYPDRKLVVATGQASSSGSNATNPVIHGYTYTQLNSIHISNIYTDSFTGSIIEYFG